LKPSTVAAAIETSAAKLDQAGVIFGHGTDSAWDEATALVLAVTGLPDRKSSLTASVSATQQARISQLLSQRIEQRIPLPYLLGRAHFAGLEFEIEAGVVIPRSPIAELIDAGFQPWLTRTPDRIIDLCCGSGCIGIAAALEFPDSTLTLVDIDPKALTLAGRNVARFDLQERTELVCSDLFSALAPAQFDLILCNPPYVDAADMRSLPAEYLHEPALGLAGGEDGLDLVHALLKSLPQRLADTGLLVCEVGASAPALMRAYPEQPFIWPDLEQGGEGIFLLAPGLA